MYSNQQSDMVEEYVLPPPNHTIRELPAHIVPRPSIQRDVRDLYDDDHYAIPDVSRCVTRGAGSHRGGINEIKSQKIPDRKTCFVTPTKMKILGVIILLVTIIVISASLLFTLKASTSVFYIPVYMSIV